MTRAAELLGTLVLIAAAIKAVPTIGRFLFRCAKAFARAVVLALRVPRTVDRIIEGVQRLDIIEAAANRAADSADAAHEEWRGASQAVANELGRLTLQGNDHERRLVSLEDWRSRLDQGHS